MSLTIGIDGRFLADHYPGIGRYTFQLTKALLAIVDDDEELVCLHGPAETRRRFDLTPLARAGARLVPAAMPSLPGHGRLPELWRLSRGLAPLHLDLFHVPHALSLPAGRWPRIVTVHDAIPWRLPVSMPSLSKRLVFWLSVRLAIARSRLVLTVSEASRADLVRFFHLPPARIVVTPEAAAELAPATPATVAELRRRLALERPYVLYLGSDRPHKNLTGLLAAWSEITAAGLHDYDLVLAGSAATAAESARRQGLGNIRGPGEIGETDLAALYSGAELFVLPSLWEGFGLPVLEAMACGTAVACSRVGSLPEVAGDAAAYFAPTTAAMAATLARLLRDPDERRQLAHRGERQQQQFSWERTARLTLDAYRRTAAGES